MSIKVILHRDCPSKINNEPEPGFSYLSYLAIDTVVMSNKLYSLAIATVLVTLQVATSSNQTCSGAGCIQTLTVNQLQDML